MDPAARWSILPQQGAALISVAVIDAMGTEAILVRPDSGITKISDLKGKNLLTTANAGVNTFFPIVLANGRAFERRHQTRQCA